MKGLHAEWMKNFAGVPLCVLMCMALSVQICRGFDDYETGFQERGRLLGAFMNGGWTLPTPNFSNSDMHYWALALALLELDEDNRNHPWLNDGDGEHNRQPLRWGIFRYDGETGFPGTAQRGPAGNHSFVRNPGYHFVWPGLARLIGLHPELPIWQVPSHVDESVTYRELYLRNVWDRQDNFNIWTGEGTENHVAMCRPNGWIFALEAQRLGVEPVSGWRERGLQMRQWMLDWADRIYQTGVGEWDSSIYYAISLQGWLNAYDYAGPDFANDAEVRAAARAVLDFYATSIALKNRQFQMSGAETRTVRNFTGFSTGTAILAWLWFAGDSTVPPGNWNGTGVGEVIYAWASDYRPAPAIVNLARLDGVPLPAQYFNSKPDYLLKRQGNAHEVLYVARDFTLGSANVGTGRFGNGNWQYTLWKLLAHNARGNPDLLWGNGGYHGYIGNAPDPWMQVVQHEDLLLQLHRVPSHAQSIIAEVEQAYGVWVAHWYRDFLQRFPEPNWGGFRGGTFNGKPVPHNFQHGDPDRALDAFLLFDAALPVVEIEGWFVLEFATVRVAAAPLRSHADPAASVEAGKLLTRGAVGEVFGWLIQVSPVSDFADAAAWIEALRQTVRWQWCAEDDSVLRVRTVRGDQLEVAYALYGDWKEPSYDFDFGVTRLGGVTTFFQHPWTQPEWPRGYGHGRFPVWSVNGVAVSEREWQVFEGPSVSLRDRVLTIEAGGAVHVVDRSGTAWEAAHSERLRRLLNRLRVRRMLP